MGTTINITIPDKGTPANYTTGSTSGNSTVVGSDTTENDNTDSDSTSDNTSDNTSGNDTTGSNTLGDPLQSPQNPRPESFDIADLKSMMVSFISDTKASFIKLEKKVDTKIGDLDTKVGKLETKIDDLDTKVGKLETKIDDLDTKVGKLDTKVGKLETTLKNGFKNMYVNLFYPLPFET